MKSFANTINTEELRQVALFVYDEFIKKKKINTFYHTPENGWANHKERYVKAFPFVLGKTPVDTPITSMSAEQKSGFELFRKACITCHEGVLNDDAGNIWGKYPLSHQGCGVVCHKNGEIDFPWEGQKSTASTQPHTPFEAHGTSPAIADLTPQQMRGETLYKKNCAFCHAMDGTGGNWIGAFLEPHARNLTNRDDTAHLDQETLKNVIRNGVADTSMPAWNAVFDDEQINAVAAYVQRAFLDPAKVK